MENWHTLWCFKLNFIFIAGKFWLFMTNRLYCTFTTVDAYEEVANTIQTSYVILFDKLFVLESLDGEIIMFTYNVDMNNSTRDSMVDNTILVHRKKQTNTLYTINALNEVIKSLNNGVLDKSFAVNWNDYRNCILLIQTEGFNRIDTKIKEIINL